MNKIQLIASLFVIMCISSCSDKSKFTKMDLLEMHNQEREARHLDKLVLNHKLARAAEYQADWISKYGLSHVGKGKSTVADRVNKFGANFLSVGENIAFVSVSQNSDQDVFDLWMDSEGHKDNILGEYSQVGFGKRAKKDLVFYVAVFGGNKVDVVDQE